MLRFKVADIRKSAFYLKNFVVQEPTGIFVGQDQIPVDDEVLQMMLKPSQYQRDRHKFVQAIQENRHIMYVTHYYLLLRQIKINK